MQEMQDVFGDVDDLLEMYAEKRATAILSKDEEGEEGLEPADEEDVDAVASFEEQKVCSAVQDERAHVLLL